MAAKSLFDCLQSFDKKNLKHTDTRVTTTTGDQIIEKRDSYGRVTTEQIPGQTYGFVASVVEDLQVGEILQGLILGSQDVAVNLEILEHYKVTHILNLASFIENKYPDKIVYKKIRILDVPEMHIIPHFEEAFEFINKGMESGCVLVHCNAGISRAATIVIAYLMKTRNMTLTQAYGLVKEKRPVISPNSGFQVQLETYEERLFEKSSL